MFPGASELGIQLESEDVEVGGMFGIELTRRGGDVGGEITRCRRRGQAVGEKVRRGGGEVGRRGKHEKTRVDEMDGGAVAVRSVM